MKRVRSEANAEAYEGDRHKQVSPHLVGDFERDIEGRSRDDLRRDHEAHDHQRALAQSFAQPHEETPPRSSLDTHDGISGIDHLYRPSVARSLATISVASGPRCLAQASQ